MKRRDWGKYIFAVGMVLLAVQVVINVFRFLNIDVSDTVYIYEYERTIKYFFYQNWGAVCGILLLSFLFARRVGDIPEPVLCLVGALLWIIYFLGAYNSEVTLLRFFAFNAIGMIGTMAVIVVAFYDAHEIKKKEGTESSHDANSDEALIDDKDSK